MNKVNDMYLVNDEVTEKEKQFIDNAIYYGKRLYAECFYRVVSVEVQNYLIDSFNKETHLIIITQTESGLIYKWLVSSQIYRKTANREPLFVMSARQIDFM